MPWDSPRRYGTRSTSTSWGTHTGRRVTRTGTPSGCRPMSRTGARRSRRKWPVAIFLSAVTVTSVTSAPVARPSSFCPPHSKIGDQGLGISSIAASNTHRWFGGYGVTESAVDHLMMLAADELGASRVRVNGIRPGLIRTDLVAPILDSAQLSEDYRICTPLPRVGEVKDIANLAMFLLSDAS